SLLITWLGLGVAYFSVYPVGFFVTSFGLAVFVLTAMSRHVVTIRQRRRAEVVFG
ncbi:MAG: metal ABC transporter permease, partial [Actinobacteria bacterium]|nr:metal ABC transporter permease [Actinomycetota bacterium]